MAQKSIHILNKNGYSMFWNSMWDDKINFSKSFKKQIFLQNFFEFLIENYNSINFFKKKFFFFKNYNNNLKFKKQFKFLKFFEKSFKNFNYENYFCNSKIWILRYQKWFIVFFFIYDLKKIIKKKKIIKFYNFNSYFNYYKNVSKLNNNYLLYLNKNIF